MTRVLLDEVRAQLAPNDDAIKLARVRRDAVRAAAGSFPGARRTFMSGSLAHATANCPIHQRDRGLDGDCGVVLDRRTWSALGPESVSKTGPSDVVRSLRDHLRSNLRPLYPLATFEVTKRAILIEFHDALPSLEDPPVDIVLGLERASAPGLWIPNTEADRWDASHPEKHTELLTADPKGLRVVRARAIRLAKAENKRTPYPPLCSFNIEAFGLMFVTAGMDEAEALLALWTGGARDLRRRLTPDPAGISQPIKVADVDEAVRRLDSAAHQLGMALTQDADMDYVRKVLQPLWPDFIAEHPGEISKAMAIAKTRAGVPLKVTGTGVLSAGLGTALKQPRSFGESEVQA